MSAEHTTLNQFILDATDAGVRLDRVSTKDDRQTIILALKRGREEFAALLHRRESLPNGEVALVQVVLDGLHARLKFLERQLEKTA